jgi:hypothetical protein
MQGAMSETAAPRVPADGADQDMRERVTLVAFVVVSVVATFAWLGLLGWLVVVGLRALGA